MVPPYNAAYRPTKQYLCHTCFNEGIAVNGYPGWVEIPAQHHPQLFRWLENEDGDIISVVKLDLKRPSRLGIDGEIRCSIGVDCFTIPCSLSIIEKKSDAEIIKTALRMGDRRKE